MPRYPEYGDDEFSLMVDPVTGRVALVCPARIISFEDVTFIKPNPECYLLALSRSSVSPFNSIAFE